MLYFINFSAVNRNLSTLKLNCFMFPLKVNATFIFTLVKLGFPRESLYSVDVSKVNVTHSAPP